MPKISTIPGIKPDEADKLQNKGIKTTEDLWKCIGRNRCIGVERLARWTRVPATRLLVYYSSLALQDSSRYCVTSEVRRLLGRILLFLALPALATVITLIRVSLPPALGGHVAAIVPNEDLKQGRLLSAQDVQLATLGVNQDYVGDIQQVVGTVLLHDVSRGKPLRYEDISRQQWVASRDIVSGTILTQDAITSTWSLYDTRAAIRADEIVGHAIRQPLQSGKVILKEMLDPNEAFPASDLHGRQAVSLVVSTASPGFLASGVRVTLYVNSRRDGSGARLCGSDVAYGDIIVLSAERHEQAASILVAVPSDAVQDLLSHLPCSDIYAVRALP